jgi:hypothetical protein
VLTNRAETADQGAQMHLGRQGFGAMRLREETIGDTDRDPLAVIHAALDAGITMVDTADAYQNEELVGRAVQGRRDEVLLASKFGLVWHDKLAGGFEIRADPTYVRQACEASLRRLDVDVIDLYYLHHRSEKIPIEETVGAIAELVDQGKVRGIGLSNVTAQDLRRAYGVHPIATTAGAVVAGITRRRAGAAARCGRPWSNHRGSLPDGTRALAPDSHGERDASRRAARHPRQDRWSTQCYGRAGGAGLGAPPPASTRCACRAASRNHSGQPPPLQCRRLRHLLFRRRVAAARLHPSGTMTAAVTDVPDVTRILVGGAVTHRQRPATAGGITFLTGLLSD